MDNHLDSSQADHSAPARLLLADAEPIVLHGLSALIKEHSDFLVVDAMTSVVGLVDAVKRHRPDILLRIWLTITSRN